MALFIEVIKGTDLGLKFKASHGLKIGRSLGDVTINEPKMSGLHAQIRSTENGKLFLIDRESSNGIKVKGVKVQKLQLLPGVTFQVGSTVFLVLEGEEPPEQVEKIDTQDWRETLNAHIPHLKLEDAKPIAAIRCFKGPITVSFVEGFQAGQKFTLGYGPRNFGLACLGFEIIDPKSPDFAFSIVASPAGTAEFWSDNPDSVLLNGVSADREFLKNGDIIRVGSTLIEIGIPFG